MPAEILAPTALDPIATINGEFDITVQYDVAGTASLQCFCENGSPDLPEDVSGSDLHVGRVTAFEPDGKRKIYIELDGSLADEEPDIDVTIGGFVETSSRARRGQQSQLALEDQIKKLPRQRYRLSGNTNHAPKTAYVVCIAVKCQVGKPRKQLSIGLAIPRESGKWSLIMRIPRNTKKVQHIVRVLYMNAIDHLVRPVTLVVP